jgi:hypothetical protein
MAYRAPPRLLIGLVIAGVDRQRSAARTSWGRAERVPSSLLLTSYRMRLPSTDS